ncbi:MAG: response regulator transcription factor [Actinomycetota bacterium]|nr:response regulator transcription factor [Actinomycetota bacterium]
MGPAGLGVEVFCEVLRGRGVAVAEVDADPPNALDVIVLVEPETEHWDAARAQNLPIVLVLGQEGADAEVVEAVLAGADAVVHADSAPEAVVRTLQEVSDGGSLLCPRQTRVVAQLARSAAARQSEVVLTRRESEIVASIAEGKAVKQTARDLGISAKTVENLQGKLFRKLGVRNRAQAVARAHGLGLL